jgi:hypothetical protein
MAKDVIPTLTPNVDYVDGMLYVKYANQTTEKIKICTLR